MSQNSVKCIFLKYSAANFESNLNLISLWDSVILNFLQLKVSLECVELEGCLVPREFTTWEQFSEEARKLMSEVFGVPLIEGTFRDKLEFEEIVSPLQFKY